MSYRERVNTSVCPYSILVKFLFMTAADIEMIATAGKINQHETKA